MRLDEDIVIDDNTYSIERDVKGVLLTGKVSINSLMDLVEGMKPEPKTMLAKLLKDLDRFVTSDASNCQLGVTFCRVKKTKATDLNNNEMIWDIGSSGYTWSFGQATLRRLNRFRKEVEGWLNEGIRVYAHISDEARDDGAWVKKILQYFNEEKGGD